MIEDNKVKGFEHISDLDDEKYATSFKNIIKEFQDSNELYSGCLSTIKIPVAQDEEIGFNAFMLFEKIEDTE